MSNFTVPHAMTLTGEPSLVDRFYEEQIESGLDFENIRPVSPDEIPTDVWGCDGVWQNYTESEEEAEERDRLRKQGEGRLVINFDTLDSPANKIPAQIVEEYPGLHVELDYFCPPLNLSGLVVAQKPDGQDRVQVDVDESFAAAEYRWNDYGNPESLGGRYEIHFHNGESVTIRIAKAPLAAERLMLDQGLATIEMRESGVHRIEDTTSSMTHKEWRALSLEERIKFMTEPGIDALRAQGKILDWATEDPDRAVLAEAFLERKHLTYLHPDLVDRMAAVLDESRLLTEVRNVSPGKNASPSL